jgi:hypothetical protein
MKNLLVSAVLLLLIASPLLVASEAKATPLLSMQAAERCDGCHQMPDRNEPKWDESRYTLSQRRCGMNCGSCHMNPDGGMLRTDGGFTYGTKTLPLSTSISEELQRAIQVVRGNRFITLGGDFRFADIITNQENKRSPFFFPMQGDLYAGSRLGDHVSFLTQFGLERNGNAAVREVFGMVDRLPFNSYVKLGKFIPPYGHRLDDHTAFIRTELFLDHNYPHAYNSGIEVGADPLVAFFRAAYFNEDITPLQNSDNTMHGYSAVAGWKGLWLNLGASFLSEQDVFVGPDFTDRMAYGVFGGVQLWRLSWLFEADLRKDEWSGKSSDADTTALITFNELNFRAARGVTIKARYETFDPDRDVDDDEKIRYLAGLDFHPFPFTEVDAQYRYNETPQEDFGQVLVLIHLWF